MQHGTRLLDHNSADAPCRVVDEIRIRSSRSALHAATIAVELAAMLFTLAFLHGW